MMEEKKCLFDRLLFICNSPPYKTKQFPLVCLYFPIRSQQSPLNFICTEYEIRRHLCTNDEQII